MKNFTDMKPSTLIKSLLWSIIAVAVLNWIACDPLMFNNIDQPENTGLNESFEVDITVFGTEYGSSDSILSRIGMALPPEWTLLLEPDDQPTDYRIVFGIMLPIDWVVTDNITFTGDDEGVFVYSDSLSQQMNLQYPPDSLYRWWVSETPETMDTNQGNIYFTPVITTSAASGNFFLDYSLGYRDVNDLHLSSTSSNDHLVTVGLPDTVYVTSLAESGPGSIRAAIDSVSQGGTILFNLFYPATIVLSEEILIYKSVNISGPENASLSISGNNVCRVFHVIDKSLGLHNLRVINGRMSSGNGGGMFFQGGRGILSNLEVTGNYTNMGGGGINGYVMDELQMENVTIAGNKAPQGQGGGIYIYSPGTLILSNVKIYNNL
jgi:hypothetical protein